MKIEVYHIPIVHIKYFTWLQLGADNNKFSILKLGYLQYLSN